MRSKLLIAAGLAVAFVLGTVTSGLLSGTSSPFQKPEPAVSAPPPEAAPVSATQFSTAATPRRITRTSYAAPRAVTVADRTNTVRKRSIKKEALIVGGSAGAGAAIGAAAGGGKGAAIGALSGGAAGLVYDLLTRNKS